jgi:hypothetical protein
MEVLFIHFYYLIIIYIISFLVYSKTKSRDQYQITELEITIFKNNINCLKSLYISNRDVDANMALKYLSEYFYKLNKTNQLSDIDLENLFEKFLELKNLLLSLNNYRGVQNQIIEEILTKR